MLRHSFEAALTPFLVLGLAVLPLKAEAQEEAELNREVSVQAGQGPQQAAAPAQQAAAPAQQAAAPAQQAAAPAARPASAPSAPRGTGERRRDPRGKTGISPFSEALQEADGHFVARNFEAALAAYRKAISLEPRNPMGHYRLGQAASGSGDLSEAEAAYSTGLRFAAEDLSLRAKLLFVLADLSERQRSFEQALTRWKSYQDFAAEHPEMPNYLASAEERVQRILAWQKLSEESAKVKERVEKRAAETEAKP